MGSEGRLRGGQVLRREGRLIGRGRQRGEGMLGAKGIPLVSSKLLSSLLPFTVVFF